MGWREERRRDEAARAEQARQDAMAAAEVEAVRARTVVEARQADQEHRAQVRRQVAQDRRQDRELARQYRAQRVAAVRAWASAHVVGLLIYPLAGVSAVMAVPAMAAFGHEVYGHVAGYLLPVITELGMWAFALAVEHTRRRHPDRPVWALQLGVWLFAAVAFTLNALHGLVRSWISGSVMGVASVAGVGAHQLVTAAPRRSRTERDSMRLARRTARKVARVQGAAVRAAVAEIAADGTVQLVFTSGRYELDKHDRLKVAQATNVGSGEAARPAAAKPRSTAKSAKRAPARRGRKLLGDYVADARASWSPGVEITPAWARRATGCSAGLSAKVARALRDEIAATHPPVAPATDPGSGDASGTTEREAA